MSTNTNELNWALELFVPCGPVAYVPCPAGFRLCVTCPRVGIKLVSTAQPQDMCAGMAAGEPAFGPDGRPLPDVLGVLVRGLSLTIPDVHHITLQVEPGGSREDWD